MPGEEREPFNILNCQNVQELGRQIARWTMDNQHALGRLSPTLPPDANNRLADNWRPLFTIAELAGSDWMQRAHDAFKALNDDAGEEMSTGKMLLKCIRTVLEFKSTDRIASKDLVCELPKLEEPIFNSTRSSRPLTAQDIAQILRPYGIKPATMRIQGELAKGYFLADFADAFARYLA